LERCTLVLRAIIVFRSILYYCFPDNYPKRDFARRSFEKLSMPIITACHRFAAFMVFFSIVIHCLATIIVFVIIVTVACRTISVDQ
jgi:hypothetical protein